MAMGAPDDVMDGEPPRPRQGGEFFKQTVAFKPRAPMVCPCCGAVMVIVKTRIRPPDSPMRSGLPPVPMVPEPAKWH